MSAKRTGAQWTLTANSYRIVVADSSKDLDDLDCDLDCEHRLLVACEFCVVVIWDGIQSRHHRVTAPAQP